jgi:hypothetical protein
MNSVVIEWANREKATRPEPGYVGLYVIYQNAWWVVNADGDLGFMRLAGGRFVAQCNPHRTIVEQTSVPYFADHGAVGVERIPAVYVPHRCEGG